MLLQSCEAELAVGLRSFQRVCMEHCVILLCYLVAPVAVGQL